MFMHQVNGKLSTPVPGGEADLIAKPGPLVPKAVLPCVPGFPPNTHPTVPDLKQPPAQPQGLLSKNVSVLHIHTNSATIRGIIR